MSLGLKGRVRAALTAVADLWWPPVCAVCPRLLPLAAPEDGWRGHFCPDCQATVEFLPAALCPVCGRPFYHSESRLCGDCLADPPPFLTARAAVVYRGAAARSIGLLKYHGDLTQTRALAGLAAALPEPPDWDVIVPLPLAPRRLAARGFNQALVLARAVFPGRPLEPGLLSRPVDSTLPQAALTRRERQRAIRGSFQAPAPGLVRGAGVLLFDDVVTTGATAAEAARTLLAAGARAVHLAAVAMTVRDSWR
jgi:predicted amidophosphoribosyltransferase